jgi:hypothetical protein
MPVVAISKISRPEHAVEYLADLIASSDLSIEGVNRYDERTVTAYPAVQILSGGFAKELHGVPTFLVTIRVDIYLMHAVMTEDRATRNYNDLALATQLVALLEKDLSLNKKIVAGWVEQEDPGTMPPGVLGKSESVISTKLHWRGTNEVIMAQGI